MSSFCNSRLGPAKSKKVFPKKKFGPKNWLFQNIVKGCLFSKKSKKSTEVMLAPNILDQLDNWGNYVIILQFEVRSREIEKSFSEKKFGPKNWLFQKIVKGCLFSKKSKKSTEVRLGQKIVFQFYFLKSSEKISRKKIVTS